MFRHLFKKQGFLISLNFSDHMQLPLRLIIHEIEWISEAIIEGYRADERDDDMIKLRVIKKPMNTTHTPG